MIDAALQRKNMVESQVRPSDVTDRRIIRAMLETPREEFVPAQLKSLAYMDTELRLVTGDGLRAPRALMAPRVFSKLLQLANLERGGVVLDVGSLTGYSTAVISRIAETVVALEEDEALADQAAATLQRLGLDNVAVVKGPLAKGYAAEGPYDAIVLEGSVAEVPKSLFEQLKDGARLVAVTGDGVIGQAVAYERRGSLVAEIGAFDAAAPRLPGFERPRSFVF